MGDTFEKEIFNFDRVDGMVSIVPDEPKPYLITFHDGVKEISFQMSFNDIRYIGKVIRKSIWTRFKNKLIK